MSKADMRKPELEEDEELVAHDDRAIGNALRVSLVAILFLVGTISGVVYVMNLPAKAPEVVETPTRPAQKRTASKVALPAVKFTDITAAAGIKFQHVTGAYGEKLLPETMGSGAAFFDYDNDGDQDLLLINSSPWPWKMERGTGSFPATLALYQNDGKGNFQDVTKEAGLDISLYGMGVACGDYDNDGWIDLFITAVGPNRLLRNVDGRFVDVTAAAGVAGADDQWGTSAGFFDYNNDGLLDLFVCNYIQWSRQIDLSLGSTYDGRNRAYAPPTPFRGAFCQLFRNEGQGRFTDVSAEAGIQVRNVDTQVPVGKSLGVVFVDLDDDGWCDIVVANDTVQNFVFRNLEGKKFQECGTDVGVAFDPAGNARGAMGIDVARFRNNSKSYGIVIGNFANEPTSLYVAQDVGGDDVFCLFTDEAVATGLGPQSRLELKFGVFFFDYDLDGRLDICTANGHLEKDIASIQRSQQYEQPPQLFWNAGDQGETEFEKVSADVVGQDFSRRMVGRGSAYADIDGDGDLDVLLTGSGGPARLLRNDQQLGHHWVRLALKSSGRNLFAYGATVQLFAGGQVQERFVQPTRGYLSQSELPLTFGLGKTDKIDKVLIRWPDGVRQEIKELEVDQQHTIEQPGDAT
ncbi:MAG TPA: CRTAC1 family protein [Pirellulaceae bacterium]|nr:CRTAC1 family protein [Pirellulaceae bacterium]